MEIIKCLNNSPIISEFKILEYKTFSNGFYIKITAYLKNQSELHIREYSDPLERNYSYHWQSQNGELIIRWDNSPHYPDLFNAPHHKHQSGKVEPSGDIILDDVLKAISKEIE
jgi:hypothetical protein